MANSVPIAKQPVFSVFLDDYRVLAQRPVQVGSERACRNGSTKLRGFPCKRRPTMRVRLVCSAWSLTSRVAGPQTVGELLGNMSRIITLTTDFGIGSPYVAEMKGAILSIATDIQLVDVTHAIQPQDVFGGALTMRQFASSFPPGTVHVCVVDPGAGTERGILLVSSGDQWFVGPDNGVLTFAISTANEVRLIDQPDYWNSRVSSTFHGRDVMGPVAAHLCNGVKPHDLSSPMSVEPIRLHIPSPVLEGGVVKGEIVSVDSFGNLISNIHVDDLPHPIADLVAVIDGRRIPFVSTYGDAERGGRVALIGSSGWVEIAVCQGSAYEDLGCGQSTQMTILAES